LDFLPLHLCIFAPQPLANAKKVQLCSDVRSKLLSYFISIFHFMIPPRCYFCHLSPHWLVPVHIHISEQLHSCFLLQPLCKRKDHKTFHVEEKNELNTTDDVFSDPMKGFIFNQKQGVSFYQLFRWKVNWRKPFAFAKPFTLVC